MRYLLSPSLCLAAALASSPASAPPPARPLAKEPTSRLLGLLGSDSYEEREAATRELMCREEAAPAVRKALRFPDAEVRRRAERILKEHDRRQARRSLDEAKQLAADGRVDELMHL